MNRRTLRRGVTLGALASGAVALARNLASRPVPTPPPATPAFAPLGTDDLAADPVLPADDLDVAAAPGADWAPAGDHADGDAGPGATTAPWVDARDGGCPTSHPVKAKSGSAIFHLPGMLNYERTRADRCYLDAATAEADGLRAAKR